MDSPAPPKWTLPEPGAAARLTRTAAARSLRAYGAAAGPGDADAATLTGAIDAAFRSEAGRPYYAASEVALREAPDRYVMRPAHAAAATTWPAGALGDGDNVFTSADRTGTVLLVRSVGDVQRLMIDGVPPGTIGVLDDAGGTMTAPVLPEFDAVLCLAGTVRSHLAIIAREFGVPTLMGTRLARPLLSGERITVTFSVPAQDVEGYYGEQTGPRALIRAAPPAR